MRLLPVSLLPLWLLPAWGSSPTPRAPHCSIFKSPVFDKQNCKPDIPSAFVKDGVGGLSNDASLMADPSSLELAYNSSVVMQREFWEHHLGTWPRAIDWTAAFIHTAFAGITDTLSKALDESYADDVDAGMVHNMVNSYFTQIVGFYFGQDHESLRGQAFDDILWVVLGWLESTNFIKSHSSLHYPRDDIDAGPQLSLGDALVSRPWHGNDWTEAFALRAREFWDLARQGWGESLCGGGMRWSPHLLVYKNAITNQLWIAASAKMYLDYPGDGLLDPPGREARNRTHLESALKGYDWLMDINMTNDAGLFVDGYHVGNTPENNTKCDVREESVYSYNQGVLLTGQRGLWEATGSPDFLRDGHQLTQNVIQATGWDLEAGAPIDEVQPDVLPPWRGIGRAGIIEERCDSTGECSQNGQTFKGIYYHHLAYFCMPLTEPDEAVDGDAFDTVAAAHAEACKSYLPWIAHNAEAALATRDARGVFGEWWGADKYQVWGSDSYRSSNYTDYRNFGIPDDDVWTAPGEPPAPLPGVDREAPEPSYRDGSDDQQRGLGGKKPRAEDPNDRGRGRTVETQNSGMSVVRAWWELSQAHGESKKRAPRAIGVGWLVEKLWRLWPFGQSLFWPW